MPGRPLLGQEKLPATGRAPFAAGATGQKALPRSVSNYHKKTTGATVSVEACISVPGAVVVRPEPEVIDQ